MDVHSAEAHEAPPTRHTSPAISPASAKIAEMVAASRRRRRKRAIAIASLGVVASLAVTLIALAVAAGSDEGGSVASQRLAPGDAVPSSLAGQLTEDGGLAVSREGYGEAWPLTVNEGTLRCDDGAVTLESSGKTYALNADAQERQLGVALAPVWVPNPNVEGARMSIATLIANGLALC